MRSLWVLIAGKQAMVWGPAAMGRLAPGDAVVMVWQGADGVAAEAERRGLEWVNCPNGGGARAASPRTPFLMSVYRPWRPFLCH